MLNNLTVANLPINDTEYLEKLYSAKDGVDVRYICTTAIVKDSTLAFDVFYRDTPHPKFGNRYFAIGYDTFGLPVITNADNVENLEFSMVEVDGRLHYSQHRHDFHSIGPYTIDGGRAYVRILGMSLPKVHTLKLKDGVFVGD